MKRRKRGEGLIRQRKDGRWEVRIRVRGKTYYAYADSWERALERRAELLLRAGREAGEDMAYRVRLGEWIAGYIAERSRHVRPNTAARYRAYAKLLEPLAHLPLAALSVARLESFYADLSTRIGQSHLSHLRSFLKAALRKAVRYGYLQHSPAEMAELPRRPPPPQRARAMTPEEVGRLLDAAQGTRYYPMVFLALALGLRRGELLGLRWEDVDWARDELHVRRAVVAVDGKPVVGGLKTASSQRVLPLLPEVRTLLLEWRAHLRDAGLDGGFIFPSSAGPEVPIAPRTLDRAWRSLLQRAGLPHYRFHDLRHTFATRAVASVDPKTVAALLGHSTVVMTLQIYAHVERERQRKALFGVLQTLPR